MSSIPATERCSTHLERAFKVFQSLHPQPLSARDLAVRMFVDPSVAYNYVKRLRDEGCITAVPGSGKSPLYKLVEGAVPPPDRRRLVPPEAVYLLGGRGRSAMAVRQAVGLDELQAADPDHVLFVLWNRQDLLNQFAIVMRAPRERFEASPWSSLIDPDTRVITFDPAGGA